MTTVREYRKFLEGQMNSIAPLGDDAVLYVVHDKNSTSLPMSYPQAVSYARSICIRRRLPMQPGVECLQEVSGIVAIADNICIAPFQCP